MSDNEECSKTFDLEQEIVKTYRLAHDSVDLRIKALALLLKLNPAKPPGAPTDIDDDDQMTQSAVQKAQEKLNGPG